MRTTSPGRPHSFVALPISHSPSPPPATSPDSPNPDQSRVSSHSRPGPASAMLDLKPACSPGPTCPGVHAVAPAVPCRPAPEATTSPHEGRGSAPQVLGSMRGVRRLAQRRSTHHTESPAAQEESANRECLPGLRLRCLYSLCPSHLSFLFSFPTLSQPHALSPGLASPLPA
jgi:hypothetical protein